MIKKYGISHQAVHWKSQETQYTRFEILTSFIIDDLKKSTIVDAGCGFAEYFKYLQNNSLLPKEYIGLDSEELMIRHSQKRFPQNRFYIKDILDDSIPSRDYYLCSGAMNILTKEEMFLFILNCYNASKKGFAFNFLKNESINKVTVSQVIGFCKGFCNHIKVENDYLDNDISVYLRKSLD